MKIAIIPARGGSRRIPRKNIRLFHGKPIMVYSIEAARESRLFDRIFVSTDDAEIAEIATGCGAEVIHRPPELAVDDIGTQEVVRHALEICPIRADEVCCIYATAPMIGAEDLRDGSLVLATGSFWYAMSVNAEPLADAGQWYWGHAEAFRNAMPLITPRTAMVPIPSERVCDINTPKDWWRAEKMYALLQEAEHLYAAPGDSE